MEVISDFIDDFTPVAPRSSPTAWILVSLALLAFYLPKLSIEKICIKSKGPVASYHSDASVENTDHCQSMSHAHLVGVENIAQSTVAQHFTKPVSL